MSKTLFYSLLLSTVLMAFSSADLVDQTKRNRILFNMITASIEQQHYEPQALNDDWSEGVFEAYIKRLDYGKRFLLKGDIEKLAKHRHDIDDQSKAGESELLDEAVTILEQRIEYTKSFYEDILKSPFDFSQEEFLESDYEKVDFAANKEQLRERWCKRLKHQVLLKVSDKMNRQEKALEEEKEDYEEKTMEEMEQESREKILENYTKWYERLAKIDYQDRLSTYVNTLTNSFDSHSSYFPPKDKEDFDIKMSGQLEGIGARLRQKEGLIEVISIVPGSPCWKQGDLEVDDAILKVAQGEDEPVDVVDMDLSDAVRLIRGKKGSEVRLTVKKTDGTEMEIPIIRDVVQLEETYAKSVLLEKDNKDMGYIYLPKFYTDFNGTGGHSCAADLEKEIEKLKNQKVEGIIIDLRGNGGGSLQEVVKMTGLFIDSGPVVQVKGRGGLSRVLSDTKRGTAYDQPIVVLVNSFSASASEILAAAIQDYGRGVIIGSASTYGKGTVQRFFDLDQALPQGYRDLGPMGSIKLTTQKFYRINGGSTQLNGVTPDIILPDNYSHIETGEKEEDFALAWGEIDPVAYMTSEDAFDLNAIQRKSNLRISNNPIFAKVEENAQRRKRESDKSKFNLQMDSFISAREASKEEADQFKDIFKEPLDFEVSTLQADKEYYSADTTRQNTHNDWRENLQKDIYLEEAINVMLDML